MNAVTKAELQAAEIKVGDTVRSYDFPNDDRLDARGCYLEGVVLSIGFQPFDGREVERYAISVTKRFWQGREDFIGQRVVYPPVNGTKSWLGHVYSGVEKLP